VVPPREPTLLVNKIDGIASILNQSQPAKNWYATKDDDQSRAAAEVCEIADPVLLDEIDYPHHLRPRLNKLVTLTNLAALVVTYDNDPKWGDGHTAGAAVQPTASASNSCTRWTRRTKRTRARLRRRARLGEPPADQQPIGVPYPKGKLSAEFLSSFEVSLPKSAPSRTRTMLPWVCTHQRWSTEDAISRWPKLKALLDGGRR
jgi:hypothetical protein